jgi:WD repeat-containing protein 44
MSFTEPDVIASTKLAHSKTTDSLTISRPEPPPRRKKKGRKLSTSSSIDAYTYCDSAKLTSTDVLPQQTTTTTVQATTSADKGIEIPPIVTNKEKVR